MSNDIKASDAAVSGQASIIRAADKLKSDLQAQPAIVRATIHITRKATGKVDTYEITGTPDQSTKTEE
jgi:hypothetical protein